MWVRPPVSRPAAWLPVAFDGATRDVYLRE